MRSGLAGKGLSRYESIQIRSDLVPSIRKF